MVLTKLAVAAHRKAFVDPFVEVRARGLLRSDHVAAATMSDAGDLATVADPCARVFLDERVAYIQRAYGETAIAPP